MLKHMGSDIIETVFDVALASSRSKQNI